MADTLSTSSNGTYTRHNAPKRSNVKPRWHTQPYMMFLALRSMPNHTAARQELINAAVALDRKFSAEKGLPRVFTGKTPMNSASACLTNNGDKYFIPFKPEGSKSTHFHLAYAPGDFDTAVKEYDGWMEKLIKHDWPLCFGVPKEGALPIHVLERREEARKVLEQDTPGARDAQSATTTITSNTNTESTSTATTGNSTSSTGLVIDSLDADKSTVDREYSADSRKRSPGLLDAELNGDARSNKKIKAEQDSGEISGLNKDTASQGQDDLRDDLQDQDSKVADKLERMELKSTSSAASSLPTTPATTLFQEPESISTINANAIPATLAASSSTTSKSVKASTPQPNSEKVDEYRLEDLDLSSVPTSLADVVRVGLSSIPNSGNGLFAKVDLPASTPLGFYFGVPMTENEFDSLKDGLGVASHYSIMYRRTVLDATDENGMPYSDPNGRLYCPFHFMNEDPSGNITFITGSVVNQVICQTNRDVKAGEELFVFYGKEVDRFWEKEVSNSDAGGEQKKGRTGSRSRAASPARREEPTTDRPRRNTIYKPARYTR
ncbi:hypothetical protein BGZ58_011315 [Dissophora ornata]|nr:hypothetical protein BGZ58_011315 [Dissophora ornata]